MIINETVNMNYLSRSFFLCFRDLRSFELGLLHFLCVKRFFLGLIYLLNNELLAVSIALLDRSAIEYYYFDTDVVFGFDSIGKHLN